MSFYSRFIRFNTTSLKLLIIILVGIPSSTTALQCYVCGGGDRIDCDNANPTNSIFIQECPPHSKSCVIQTDGSGVSRTCDKDYFHDCKTANHVQYCYCSHDLCNGKDINISDDEDLLTEGSGAPVSPKQDPSKTTSSVGRPRFALPNESYLILFALLLC